MKTIITLALAFILGCLAVTVFAADPTPAEKRVAEIEAEAVRAKVALEQEREVAKARAKAEWNAKSYSEAWKIRGQAVVDAGQYSVGQVGRGIMNADGYLGMAVAYPSSYAMAAAFTGAEASKSYALSAWDNDVKTEVALKVGDKEVKASVPTK